MTGFTIQEFIISGFYIWRTLDILKTTDSARNRTRRVMWQLFGVSVIIVILDIALLVVEYQDRHVIEQALKAAVYGIKLKLEFAILSKLVGITQSRDSTYLGAFEDFDDLSTQDTSRSPDNVRSAEMGKTDMEKDMPLHIERRSSTMTGVDPGTQEDYIRYSEHSQPAHTADAQRRRRTLDQDLYASACRDFSISSS